MAVIETITLRLNEGASADAFAAANAKVESEYLPAQPGFNPGSRVTTLTDDGTWTISLRWDSAADADASMAVFSDAPATQDFLALVDASQMAMDRTVEVASAASPALDNARRLYMEGIRDGNARQAVETYTGDRYTQHSTGVRDGVEGFVEFFEPFIERNTDRNIEIVRSVVDGRFVFLQAAQELNGGESRWVTTDLFDTDGNHRIIEHWDVIHELGGTNPAGRTQVDGATEITDLHLTEANKAVVMRLMTEAFCEEPTASFGDFISAETYMNHNPDAPDGLEALMEMDRMSRKSGERLFYKKVYQVVGQGNFVVSFAHQVWNDIDYAAFDIFRLEDGLIVEHWDNVETLPDPADLVNSGKF
ncbi:MAG: nuclear transport factor 2 family protein [Actinomycetota bacterium]